MKKNMDERIAQAQSALERVQAIGDVYALLLNAYKSDFMKVKTDENGDYVQDEDGDYVYEPKFGDNPAEEDCYCWPYYDGKRWMKAKELFEEILANVEKMK